MPLKRQERCLSGRLAVNILSVIIIINIQNDLGNGDGNRTVDHSEKTKGKQTADNREKKNTGMNCRAPLHQ